MVAKGLSCALALGWSLLASFVVRGASVYVNASVPSSGDGASWSSAFKAIQEGINAAAEGDQVVVAVGTYVEAVDFKGKGITVRSTDEGDPAVVGSTVIEAGSSPDVVRFRSSESRNAVIAGFTITSGQAGVSCVWSSPVIRSNIIQANTADFGSGGGISCYYSSPLIENNIIASNLAAGGGAGIACEGAQPVIIGNLILGNVTDTEGGGILCMDCTPTIAGNRIIANVCQGNGGGISSHGSNVEALNNLIVSNVANSVGGGVAAYRSVSRMVGDTIANNSSQGGGAGGIHFLDSSGLVVNCVLWQNGDDISGCSATFSCIEDDDPEDQGEGNIHDNPGFMDPNGTDNRLGTEDDDYRLSAGSSCLDKGSFSDQARLSIRKEQGQLSLSWSPGVDLLGQNRISGGGPDMGCYEYQSRVATYVLESSLNLREWSVIHSGSDTGFLLAPVPPARERFFRVSLSRQ